MPHLSEKVVVARRAANCYPDAMRNSPKPKIALISLGCPKNLVDSEVMLGLLDQAGYPIVEDVTDADIAILNTCAFIEPAQEEAIEALLDLAEIKSAGDLRAVICAGCLPQRYGRELADEFPEIAVFVQVGAEPRIVEAVQAASAGRHTFFESSTGYALTCDLPRWRSAPQWLSYLRIAEGCDHRCTFCTVPAIRGTHLSREPQDILKEYEQMVGEGLREIIVIAQDTTAYGHDLAPRKSLADLLRVLAPVAFDGWVRLMYTHPGGVDEDLLNAMADLPAMVPYLDLPLQHASSRILRAMGRPGDAEEYLHLLETTRRIMPDLAIRTTFIVGFPGETDEDFQLLLDFAAEARFDRLSAFAYSPEAGTVAAEMPDQVELREALDRMEALMRCQEGVSLQKNTALVGKRMRVLVERKAPERELWFARSYRDAPEVDCEVKVETTTDGCQPGIGSFCEVEITGAEIHDLNARLLGT